MERTKKVAVIIKHPYRDYDTRIDIYTVPEDLSTHDLCVYVNSQMLGPFEIIGVTEKVCLTAEYKEPAKTFSLTNP